MYTQLFIVARNALRRVSSFPTRAAQAAACQVKLSCLPHKNVRKLQSNHSRFLGNNIAPQQTSAESAVPKNLIDCPIVKMWSSTEILSVLLLTNLSVISCKKSFFDSLSDSQLTALIKEDCGDVCNTAKKGSPGKYFDEIHKEIDCRSLFESPLFELSSKLEQPPMMQEVPEDVLAEFGYQKRVSILSSYMNDAHGKTHSKVWTEATIEAFRERYRTGKAWSAYGKEAAEDIGRHMKEHMSDQVKDGHVLIIGSQSPWLEAIALEVGAEKVTTLEYEEISCAHPNVTTVTPAQLNKAASEGTLPQFDAVVTFSSLEHSGLGRYGDGLNPWGDLIASAKAFCLTRPGGRGLFGVPVGQDAVLFNACRVYGRLQLSHLFANWRQVYTEARLPEEGKEEEEEETPKGELWAYQPLFVVEKSALVEGKGEL